MISVCFLLRPDFWIVTVRRLPTSTLGNFSASPMQIPDQRINSINAVISRLIVNDTSLTRDGMSRSSPRRRLYPMKKPAQHLIAEVHRDSHGLHDDWHQLWECLEELLHAQDREVIDEAAFDRLRRPSRSASRTCRQHGCDGSTLDRTEGDYVASANRRFRRRQSR